MIGYFYRNRLILRKFLKISLRVLLGIFLLLLLFWGFLQTETGQNWLARQVTKRLSRDLQTHISIDHVRIGLFSFDKMDLEGVLVEDQKKDTLLYAGKFQVRITDWFFFRDKAELKYVGLENAIINLNRTDSLWNYHFLEAYFGSGGQSDTATKKKSGIEFDLKKVVMKNVRFIKKDAWMGNDMIAQIGGLDMDAREITITNRTIDVTNLVLDDPYFSILDYEGRYVSATSTDPLVVDSIVKKAGESWRITFGDVKINNGRFRNDRNNYTPTTTAFDGAHVDFRKINGSFRNIGWAEDTVTGYINLTAEERSGLQVKSLKAKSTFHPKAMIFDELYLQTNRSTISDYFAMRYDDIGDMSDFMHKVRMEALSSVTEMFFGSVCGAFSAQAANNSTSNRADLGNKKPVLPRGEARATRMIDSDHAHVPNFSRREVVNSGTNGAVSWLEAAPLAFPDFSSGV